MPTLICPKCSYQTNGNELFCCKCGTQLQAVPEKTFCKACGAELKSGADFCSQCGAGRNTVLPQLPQHRTDNKIDPTLNSVFKLIGWFVFLLMAFGGMAMGSKLSKLIHGSDW